MESTKVTERSQMTSSAKTSRPLGQLEVMYHLFHKRGVDIFAQLLVLASHETISREVVERALAVTVRKHPLLRMKIQEDTSTGIYSFVEMDKVCLKISETLSNDWEEILEEAMLRHIDTENGPLWGFTLVNTEKASKKILDRHHSTFQHTFSFAFACHHSIADFMYLRLVYSDFLETITDSGKTEKTFCKFEKHSHNLFPSIEKVLRFIFPTQTAYTKSGTHRQISPVVVAIRPNHNETNVVEALHAYQRTFKDEIYKLSFTSISTGALRYRLAEDQSKSFFLGCKSNNSTVTAGFIIAACASFVDISRKSIPSDAKFATVPIEIMINLRKYLPDEKLAENFPGCAAIHVPFVVEIPLNSAQFHRAAFWDLSRECNNALKDAVLSKKPLETMLTETQNELYSPVVTVGKSKFVLFITNCQNIDGIVKPEIRDKFKLLSLPGLSTIGIDDMPTFYLNVFTLDNKLNIDIGYCKGYTREQTAREFLWQMVQHMTSKCRL